MVNQRFLDFSKDISSLVVSQVKKEETRKLLEKTLAGADDLLLEQLYKRTADIKQYLLEDPKGPYYGIRKFCQKIQDIRQKSGNFNYYSSQSPIEQA